jgi:hypothetical protein
MAVHERKMKVFHGLLGLWLRLLRLQHNCVAHGFGMVFPATRFINSSFFQGIVAESWDR